jgi:hypothetical protein
MGRGDRDTQRDRDTERMGKNKLWKEKILEKVEKSGIKVCGFEFEFEA